MFPFKRFPYRQLAAETHRAALERIRPLLPDLTDLTSIDDLALEAWQAQWVPAMPEGELWSDWDWAIEMRRWRRKRNRFDMAIWSGDHLSGLVIGRASPAKQNFSIRVLQGSPIDNHRLKGQILPIVIEVGTLYGTALGCQELRFLQPLPGMISRYEALDFRLARSSRGMQYCVRSLEGGCSDDRHSP